MYLQKSENIWRDIAHDQRQTVYKIQRNAVSQIKRACEFPEDTRVYFLKLLSTIDSSLNMTTVTDAANRVGSGFDEAFVEAARRRLAGVEKCEL
jgi:hypothetical protein